jgi:hypothetical protein
MISIAYILACIHFYICHPHLLSTTFGAKSSVLVFPAKTESDHFFPPKLKSTDLVGLSGQKPNWLGSFRAKSDFWELN